MEKPAGGSYSRSQCAMAAWGEVWVSSSDRAKPGHSSVSTLLISSARLWLLASMHKKRASGSIHTQVEPCLVKAMGSKSSLASSLSSRLSFLPGLRPLSCSMRAFFSSTLRASTLAGSIFDSVMKRAIHCPATLSSSAPCASPRGGTKPLECSCVAPQVWKGAFCSAASAASQGICQVGAMR